MKCIIKPSDCVINPVEDMGIICLNRNNTKVADLPAKLKELNSKGYKLRRIYCYEHSGRVFSESPLNSCPFDNYFYGTFAFPAELELTEEFVKSIYELYTQWAEGEVYDYIIIEDTEDDKCSSIFDYFLEKIDYQSMYENGSMLIQNFMKANKISKKSISEDINYDERFAPLRSLYLGKNKQGLITYKEIENIEWNYEIYGIDSIEKELDKL